MVAAREGKHCSIDYGGWMAMRIPDSLKILGHKVDVFFPYVFTEREDGHALADPDNDRILIADQSNGVPLSEAKIAENFLHEIGHFVSYLVTGNIRLGEEETTHAMYHRVLFAIIRENDLDFRQEEKP
jgi:hypothetical protein